MRRYFLNTGLFMLTIMFLSCNKFSDKNLDPTKPTSMDPQFQLVYSQLRFSGDLDVQVRLSLIELMPMIQQATGPYACRYGGVYIKNPPYMAGLWEGDYPNTVVNIVDAVENTKNDPTKTNLNAICRIMKVYIFARLTDLYGDIPYSEAGRAYTGGISQPKFDKQKDIYDDFFKELSEASAQLDPTKDAVSREVIYNGDISKWKKFANSLHLRLAMRLVKVDPDKAKTEAQAAYSAGVFTSNDDIAMTRHEDFVNTTGDFRGNAVNSSSMRSEANVVRVTSTMVDLMKKTNDPRLTRITANYLAYNPALDANIFQRKDVTEQVRDKINIVGMTPGQYLYSAWWVPAINIDVPGRGTVKLANDYQTSQYANFLLRFNAPFFHETYAEVEFLLAEATVRWGLNLGGTAQSHYEKGMRAAVEQLQLYPGAPAIPSSEIDTFIQNNLLQTGTEIQQINEQMYFALMFNAPEGYANWRRTGYPVLVPAITAESQTTAIPRRFEYPLSEKSQNAVNVNKAIQDMGGTDDWTNRVWWDK
jgi:hypothetical protein